ncbi:MAG: septum formation inhibitor Maf [endosymbiont of Galathealinum brachiosum]|uniref:dTTP/UTP pyrophosphatase n=1 Tax=endosymbiont of Galathealinum brachiosum TaxID=2200906 RepID=A0A370DJB3_9GAMM|nr:MAG: septum formation inhibitor Maf [endosymbiont of Galathealinum brachiosum]
MTNTGVSDKPQITLASSSPRRRELLDQIQVSYNVLPVDIDESYVPGETAEQFVTRLALEKARSGYKTSPLMPALGSDTIVLFDHQILGKPKNRQDALNMLQMLSGKNHQVMTAVAICNGETEHCVISASEVEFAQIDDQQAEAYWETGEPVDKAGGYGIQGIAAQFIKNIKGSYSGIMGLPLYETVELLKRVGIKNLK